VRMVGEVLWLAAALEVKSRLWLGGVVSVRRDRELIRSLLWRVYAPAVRWRGCFFVHRRARKLPQGSP
jgi:hypothetical protein